MAEQKTAKTNIPSIQRTIDGCTYTVLIHFSEISKESPADKMKRILLNEVSNERFTA